MNTVSNPPTDIFYRRWPELTGSENRAVVLLHRGHEHSGRLQSLVDEFNLPQFTIFAWDARGHGRTPGRRGAAPSAGAMVRDLDTFIRRTIVPQGIPMENIVVIGQSVGSLVAAAWVHDYAPKIRAMVLAAPAFKIKLYVPFARPALRLLCAAIGDMTLRSYVKAKWLTHDRARIRSFTSDPLITRKISAKLLLELDQMAARVVADAAAIIVPTQMLLSGSDFVVEKQPQLDFFEHLGSLLKEKHEFGGFYHDTLGEKDRRAAIGQARRFILQSFQQPCEQRSLLQADKDGATRREFENLTRPLSPGSAAALKFGALRTGINFGGKLSTGLRLGLKTGFDSGSTLDYVYLNKPSGITPLGRLIDRLYLGSIGWRGIRVRKAHVEKLVSRAIDELRRRNAPVRFLDIAAGHGRYVLDALNGQASSVERILLRDWCADNVTQGRALISERSLTSIARFERGDAFDRDSIASIEPKPSIAIVSGLYELFPENAAVRQSLAGLSEAIPSGGYLVYSGQPWHPQLELIARTLASHRGHQPWIMRRRTQAEMDQLVETAGFEKIDQLTDDWGVFTVSLARRAAS
jgi:alpha-beta hydrolase superfamily lysophospholipase